MFEDHIQGKINPETRTAGRKDKDLNPPVTNTIEEEEDDEAQEVNSRPRSTVSDVSTRYNPVLDAKKYAIPDDCILEFLKLNKVEPLGDDFLLCKHPYPQIEGEMIIYQLNNDDKADKDLLAYRDYSLVKRQRWDSTRYTMNAAQKKERDEKLSKQSALQCL